MKWIKQNMSKSQKALVLTLIFFLTFATVFGGIFLIKSRIHGRFPIGTYIAGVEVSGLTREEALTTLNKEIDQFLQTPVDVEARWTRTNVAITPITIAELGVKPLTGETVNTVAETDSSKISIFRAIFPAKNKSSDTPLLIHIDETILRETMEKYFAVSGLAPKSAGFYFEGKKLAISDEENGKEIDFAELKTQLQASASTLTIPTVIAVNAYDAPALVTKTDLETQYDRINQQLNQKITLVDPVYTDGWDIRLVDHLDWVKFVQKIEISFPHLDKSFALSDLDVSTIPRGFSAQKIVQIEIDEKRLNEFIDEEISRWLDTPATPVNISLGENDRATIEGQGQDGREIQRAALKKGIELALKSGISEVPIPVITLEPELTVSKELQELGIKERLVVGHTSYYGSPANRVHNIKTGASKFDGLVIAPGEEFSFNTNLGAVDDTTGYRKELVIKPEGTIPEYGGGLCQVSTTVYRAALLGGLPISERNQHSYAVTYYSQIMGHGLDATIYLGGADLKFINDTGQHLLVHAYVVDDYELYVILYGTNDGRSVEMEGPYISGSIGPGPTIYQETGELPKGQTKQVEKAHSGFRTLWYRYLTDASGNTTKEEINTSYKAVPAKILVGTSE